MQMKEARHRRTSIECFQLWEEPRIDFFFKKYNRDEHKLGRRMRNSCCLRIYKFLFIKQLYKLIPQLYNATSQANDIKVTELPLVILFGLRVS